MEKFSKLQKHSLLVGVTLTVYAYFGLAWIRLPGPQQDELIFLNTTLTARVGNAYLGRFRIFKTNIPTMVSEYVGGLKGWIWSAFFSIWKPTIYSVRIPAVLLAGLALFLFYRWARKWYPHGVALFAMALAAVDPSYIYTARLDWGPVVLCHVFIFSGLLLGTLWYERSSADSHASKIRRYGPLAAAGFCFGLGLWDKATFIWFLAALAASLMLFFPRKVIRCIRPAVIAIFVLSLLAGSFPLAVYNYKMRQKGTIAKVKLEPLTSQVLANKVENLGLSLAGESIYGMLRQDIDLENSQLSTGRTNSVLKLLSWDADKFTNPFPAFLLLAVAVAPFLSGYRKAALFPISIAALMWVQMMIAKDGGFSVHHYALAYPFPHLAVAAVAGRVWTARGRWLRGIIALLATVLFAAQLSSDARYVRLFRETGGSGNWTDAVYQIADFVMDRNPPQLVVMDWGFSNPMRLLVQGRVPMDEYYSEQVLSHLADLIRQPNVLFLQHGEGFEVYRDQRNWLEQAATQAGAICQPIRNFYQRDGRLVAYIAGCDLVPSSPD